MSTAHIFRPPNRLRHVLEEPAGPPAAELIAAAEQRIGALKPQIRQGVEDNLAELLQLAEQPEESVFADCELIGRKALAIAEVASLCDAPAIGEAAQGVYAMVRALLTKGVWHTEALMAHVQALRMLNAAPAPSAEESRAILDRLNGMRAFIGVPL